MAPTESLIAWIITVLFSLCIIGLRASPDTSPVYSLCNPDTFKLGGDFDRSRAFVLNDVSILTPKKGFDYYSESPLSDDAAYGHGACNPAISIEDCADCMYSAMYKVFEDCGLRYGGQVQLMDCRIRYESYSFSE